MWNSDGFMQENCTYVVHSVSVTCLTGLRIKLIFSGTVYGYSKFKDGNYLKNLVIKIIIA